MPSIIKTIIAVFAATSSVAAFQGSSDFELLNDALLARDLSFSEDDVLAAREADLEHWGTFYARDLEYEDYAELRARSALEETDSILKDLSARAVEDHPDAYDDSLQVRGLLKRELMLQSGLEKRGKTKDKILKGLATGVCVGAAMLAQSSGNAGQCGKS